MAYSSAISDYDYRNYAPHDYYQPSLFDLARQGNCQAIAYWINGFLGPQGIYAQVRTTRSKTLQILLDFQRPRRKEQCLGLQSRLVRFICYRLWMLNSSTIDDVRIVGRFASDFTILWKQTVRIVTPANALRLRTRSARQSTPLPMGFRIVRSLFLSSSAMTGLVLGYGLVNLKLATVLAADNPVEPHATIVLDAARPHLGQPTMGGAIARLAPTMIPEPPVFPTPDRFRGEIVHQVAAVGTEKLVALTFDDGPWPETTPAILEMLRRYDVRATFFWVGLHLQQYPDIARQIVAEGHAVGNHTMNHRLAIADPQTASKEVDGMADLIYEITGAKTELFRPPGGLLNTGYTDYARQQDYAVTMWNVDAQDYYGSTPIVIDNVLRDVQPGSIVLLHDGGGDRSATVRALPQIIMALRRQGYRFVTLPELLESATPAVPPETDA
jgi:peptidoglycan/xylan/chitin deacetylase (PgdA/CDA1 family)